MNANRFWQRQLAKNRSGQPKYIVETEPDTPEEKLMSAWIERWQNDFTYFNNLGCGCCINIYEFDAPAEAIAQIPTELIHPYNAPKRNETPTKAQRKK